MLKKKIYGKLEENMEHYMENLVVKWTTNLGKQLMMKLIFFPNISECQ